MFRRGYSSLQGWVRSMADSHDRRFDELYDRHFREVLAYCLRRGQDDDAHDAANEIFAIAWRRIEDVPLGDSARPWLFVVAKRVLYRRRRGSRRFHRLVESGIGEAGRWARPSHCGRPACRIRRSCCCGISSQHSGSRGPQSRCVGGSPASRDRRPRLRLSLLERPTAAGSSPFRLAPERLQVSGASPEVTADRVAPVNRRWRLPIGV